MGAASDTFEVVDGSNRQICLIGTDKALCAYGSYNGSNYDLNCVVVTISGTTVTIGTPVKIADGAVFYVSASTLETDKAIVCYGTTNPSSLGVSKVITISGTTPTIGTGETFNAAATAYISCSTLDSTHVITCYADGGNSNFGTSQVLSISGTTITPGTEYVFSGTTATTYTSITSISATQAVITYEAGGGNSVVTTNSTGTLSYGTPATFTDGQYNSTAKIDSTHVIIASQMAATNTGQSMIGTISGTGITLGTAYSYNAAESTYNSVCHLGSNKSAIAYTDVGNSSYGTAAVNTWATSDYSQARGVCTTNTSSGGTATVLLNGLMTGLSSLVPNSPYYLQSDFSISTTAVALNPVTYNASTKTAEIEVGVAKSATELWVNVKYK